MAAAGHVQHVGGAEEPVHRLGDEAAIPGAARGIDAGLARVADGLAADAFVGVGERRAGEQRFRARAPCRRAGTPRRTTSTPPRTAPHALDRRADARHDVDAVLRVADREGQHVGEFPGAPVAQQQAPGVERAGHHRGQHAGARGSGRCRARGILPASRPAARRPGRRSPAASGCAPSAG